jgi:hypothetical protein
VGKFVKVLASSAFAAGSCLPSVFQSAVGQSLPPVLVTGKSSGGGGSGGSGFPGAGLGGYSGGGGCQSCGGYPEGEFGSSKPAPPPKSAQQKQKEREKCENTRNEARSELQTSYTAQMGVCASRNSTTFGYFSEQVKQFMNEAAGVGPGDCSTNLTRQYYQMLTIYDNRRDVCVAAANKG